MIINYKGTPAERVDAIRYSIFDATTGECLDREHIFYADDEAGYYHRHLCDERGNHWVWDSRDRRKLTGTFRDPTNPVPDECAEVAWERVDRPIVLRRRRELEV